MSFIANGKQDVKLSSVVNNRRMATAVLEPEPLEKRNWLIHLQHVRGEISKCKDLIKNEIKNSGGKHEYAYFKQGIILREEGKVQDALESFQSCYKLNTDYTDNIKEVAKCLFLLRRYRLALEAYLEAEKNMQNPDWEIYHNIGHCLMCLGEVANAKEYVKRAAQLGKQENSYAFLIKLLVSEGDYQAAVGVCTTALESCPDSTNMLKESGLLYLKLGRTQDAFQSLSAALALHPTCSQALLGVGCITQAHEEYDVALSKYKIAVQTNPDSVALWNNIGMCFYSKQKYIAAVSCLKRALWISPLNWKVLLNLGLVHLSTLQPASAFNFLCAAVNLRPGVAACFTALGCALCDLKDAENSLRAFRQATLLSNGDGVELLNTCVALMINGLHEECAELLRQFKSSDQHVNILDKQVLDLEERLNAILSPGNQVGIADAEKNSEKPENGDNNIAQGAENVQTLDADQKGFDRLGNDVTSKQNVTVNGITALQSDEV